MPPQSHNYAFHVARSQLIDQFADIEACLVKLLVRAGACSAGELLFGRKIELLRKAKPSPQFSKANKALAIALADEIEPYSLLRADIVHARLQIATIEGQELACFVNARCAGNATTSARLVSAEQFKILNHTISKLTQRMKDLAGINPPASPPPPSPGAAGGP